MRKVHRIVGLGLLLLTVAATTLAADRSGPHWFWSDACRPEAHLRIEVRHRGTALERLELPACRYALPPKGLEPLRLALPATLSSQFRAPSGTALTLDLWQAGGESDSILLGASVQSSKRIYLNTLIVAPAGEKTITELAPDLRIATSFQLVPQPSRTP